VIFLDKLQALKYYFGYETFRNNQEEIIDSLLEKKDTIAILNTGGGKSICFQIPALISSGITIVITPLISLMHNQVGELKKNKIKAEYITSEMGFLEINSIIKRIKKRGISLLYISPERMENSQFCAIFKNVEVSYLIVDEAHCISVWGNDFRPSYKAIKLFINSLDKRPTIGAFTATANKRVVDDIAFFLDMNYPDVYKSSFDRKNLYYFVVKTKRKFDYLIKYLLKSNGIGIIYTVTRKEANYLYEKLIEFGFNVGIYHGGLDASLKDKNLKLFMEEKIKIMVATNAFGMGINKPNIRYVINYSIPLSIEDLSQQSGRCSRDNEYGECILLFDPLDIKTCEYFIKKTKCETKELEQEIKKVKYSQLRSVIDYATNNKCLHYNLVSYFGEMIKKKCFMCSNCAKIKNRHIK